MEIKDILLLLEKFEESDLRELKVKLKGDEFNAFRSELSNEHESSSRVTTSSEVHHGSEKGNSFRNVQINKENIVKNEESKKEIESKTEESDEAMFETMKKINSPIVGTYFSRPSVKDEPFVKLNEKVKKGDVLCILEAMKIMNEIKSPVDGTVRKIALKDTDMADFGKTLFIIEED
ncbi:MAG: biotin/lipoyl-containing protein [Clostridiaceae bacterium]